MPNTKKYLVGDHMRSPAIAIHPDATLREAIELMLKEKTNGIVVTDEDGTLRGILSSWDIIEHIVPDYLEEDMHLAPFEDGSTFVNRIRETANDPVNTIMTKEVHAVKASSTIMEATTTLSEHGIRQLPVVDDEQKVIGYLNRTDIKKLIGEVLGITE